MIKFFVLPIVGFCMGIATIALGGGCGGIYVGILTIFFNIPPAVATSTSLATMFPTATVSAFSHWKIGNVNVRTGLIMLAGGVVGSIIGSLCSGLLPTNFYNKLIGTVIIVLTIPMIVSFFRKRRTQKADSEEPGQAVTKSSIIKAAGFGLIGGVITGLVGSSGTTAIMAGLTILGSCAIEVIGTSVFVLAGISIIGFVVRLGIGNIDWTLVGLLAIGAVLGAILGAIILKRMKTKIRNEKMNRVLQSLLIIMNLAIGILQLFK